MSYITDIIIHFSYSSSSYNVQYAYVIFVIQLLVGVVGVGRSLVDRVVAVVDQECNQAYRVAAAEDLEQNFPLHVALLHNMYTHLGAIQHFSAGVIGRCNFSFKIGITSMEAIDFSFLICLAIFIRFR